MGTGSAAAKTANVVTTTSTTEARTVGVAAQGTTNVSNDALLLTGVITALSARTNTEIAAFDPLGTGSPPTGGNMVFYSDLAAINLSTGDSLSFTMALTFALLIIKPTMAPGGFTPRAVKDRPSGNGG